MGKTSQKQKEKRLAGRVSLALAAGMFSVVPVAHGMPTLDNVEHGDVKFNGATPNPGDVLASGAPITSGTKNNIINWKDFSVAHGEHVNFADNNNYMNIVTGKATSAIDGMLSSKGGDIYVINPNGVIFGKNAEVNVGNLYVSTRAATDTVKNAFLAGNNAKDGGGNPAPICTPFGDVLTAINNNTATAAADVVNLIDKNGYVAANKVVMEGRNIRFLNTDSVAKADTVARTETTVNDVTSVTYTTTNTFVSKNDKNEFVISSHPENADITLRANSNGYIHVGDERNTYNNSTAHFTSGKVDNGNTSPSVVNYTLIHNAAELQAINNNKNGNTIIGNYMLTNDINDATITKTIGTANASGATNYTSPSGTPYKGYFDGMFFTVETMDLKRDGNNNSLTLAKSYAGLFAYTKDAVIENVGVSGANVPTYHAGGIVGYADKTTLCNVWNAGGSNQVGDDKWAYAVGGLVGVAANGTKITNSYNKGKVVGAGLVGVLYGGTISNAYNIGNITAYDGKIAGIFSKAYGENNIKNTYTAAIIEGGSDKTKIEQNNYTVDNSSSTSVSWGNNYIIRSDTKYNKDNEASDKTVSDTHVKSIYSGFDITNVGGLDEDGNSHTWRIYEGSSLPMLTAFFKGTVSTDYTYDKNGTDTKVEGGHALDANGNPVDGNPSKVYDANAVNPAAAFLGMNATLAGGSTNGKTADTKITANGNVNAKSNYALFTGEQQGYDLYGNYFTIEKRKIAFTQDTAPTFEKIYDGNADGTDALKAALMNASSTSTTGFIGKDKDYVDFQVKAGVTATYGVNGDTWTNKSDASVNGNWDIKVDGASSTTITLAAKSGVDAEHANTWQNYDLTGIDALNKVYTGKGVITPRSIKVSLRSTDGINKAYDGTSDLVGTFTVNEGTELEPDEKTYSYATDNLLVALDETGLTDAEKTALKTNDFNNQDVAINEHNSDTNPGGYTSGYVDNSGNATSVVTGTADSTKKHVAYKGIKLAGNALSSNYQLTDADGKALTLTDAEDASKGYTLLADGKINRRNISKNDLEYKDATDHPLQKVYDNTSTLDDTALAGKTVGMVDGKLIDFTKEGVTPATHTTGLLSTDANSIAFVTTGKGTFYTDATGKTEAKDATASGLATAANKVGYGVVLTNTSDAAVAANYTIGDGDNLVNLENATGFTLMTDGEILRRSIAVDLVTKTGITKTYDGTNALDEAYTTGTITADIDGNSDGNLQYTSTTKLAADDVSIYIDTTALDAYLKKTGYQITHGEAKAQDVALDEMTKAVLPYGATDNDTKNITFTIAMSGDKAANYTLNGVNMTEAVDETPAVKAVTIGGTGKIEQRELEVGFADVKKVYDGSSAVTNKQYSDTIDDRIRPIVTVTGLTGNGLAADEFSADPDDDNFIFELSGTERIQGTYGKKDANDVFHENANVIDGAHDVEYTAESLTGALKSKNYKISNTKYGVGYIKKRTIGSDDIDKATDVVNKDFEKVYDGNAKDTKYLNQDPLGTFIKWKENDDSIPDKDTLTFTIADAVYAGADAGEYNYDKNNKTGGVTVTFKITGSAAGNYEFEGADEDGKLTLEKLGYNGTIDKRKVAVSLDSTKNPTKDYDGGLAVKADGTTIGNETIKGWFTLSTVASETTAGRPSGIVEGEDVDLQVTSAQYTDKNAGTNPNGKDKTVQYAVSLKGTTNKAANYELVEVKQNGATAPVTTMQGVGTINQRTVYVSSVDELDKAFDGNANVLAQGTKGIHLTAQYNASSAEDKALVEGSGNVKGLLEKEGLAVIKPVAADAASGVKGQYGDIDANGVFTANANVNRTSVTENEKQRDTRYEGMDEAFATVYKNYKLSVDLSNAGSTKVKTENNKNIVYGKGTIKAAEINIDQAAIDNGITKVYDGTATIAEEDWKDHLLNVDSGWLSLLDITAEFTGDNAAEHGTNKPISLTIVMKNSGTDALNHKLSGTETKKTVNGTGAITHKTLYATVVEGTSSLKEKVYDGTANLTNDITGWVQLEEGSAQDVAAIAAAGGDNVALKTGVITTSYVVKDNNNTWQADKNANDEKTILFSGVVLADATNADYTKGNYTLKFRNANKQEVPDLTTTGKITKKQVNLNLIFDPAQNAAAQYVEKDYNNSATISEANKTYAQGVIAASVTEWKDANLTGALAADEAAFDVNTSGLTGKYGSWDPTAKNFTTDVHVHREGDNPAGEVLEHTHDLMYYGFKLADAVAGNYELANATDYKIDGANLAGTVYFQEAQATGTIRPLTMTMDAIKEKWATPVTKVYDGSASVVGYKMNGEEITVDAAKKYLTIYWDADNGTEPFDEDNDVIINYDFKPKTETGKDAKDNMTYVSASAGSGKTMTFSNLTFSSEGMGDYTITGGSLADHYSGGVTSTTSGTIARRLVNVDQDNVAHNKTYNGKDEYQIVASGEEYTLGVEAVTNHTGILESDVSPDANVPDKAYITYEANYVKDGVNDANVAIDADTGKVTFKDVKYTFTLAGTNAANYTLQADQQTTFTDAGAAAAKTKSVTQTNKSMIKQREVYVDFVNGGKNLDKMYDNSSALVKNPGANDETSLLTSGNMLSDIIKLAALDEENHTGIVEADKTVVKLDYTKVQANYVDGDGVADEDVATMTSGTVTTKKVYFQNLMLTGTEEQRNNYVLKAKNGSSKASAIGEKNADNSTKMHDTLVGEGTIGKRKIELAAVHGDVNKTYDGNAYADYYYDADGKVKFNKNNVTVRAAGTYDGKTSYGLATNDTIDDLNLEVDRALYYAGSDPTSDAASGLGVTYKLKFDNKNYELVRYTVSTNGSINKKQITAKAVNAETMSKIYDGSRNVTKTSEKLAEDLFEGVLDKDKAGLLAFDANNAYAHADTGAAADSKYGEQQDVTFHFTITDGNYTFDTANGTTTDDGTAWKTEKTGVNSDGLTTGTFTGKGRIDRAPLTLVPNSATYSSGDTIPTDGYTGTVMGFKNGENLADAYVVTFARDPQNLATTPGKYSLVGYVNGQLPTQANGLMYYNNLGDGATGNYYFVQQPNNALQINAKADVMDEVNQSTIADKKFTPDDYSYNRMSKDPDLTRMNRESSATVQYSEKGVNIDGDDTKSGLSALADIKGAGSVVNLEGAFIRTSAPAEQPETVAAEAALPVPETEESDISSISLEYAGDGDNSQALLEILTNASSNAEKKGTSIVIDAQDEDEEDAEEEKSRRAIFADRSNIGIETLGDAVNLNQMIG